MDSIMTNTPEFWEHMHDVFLGNNDLRDNPEEYPVIASLAKGDILELGCAFGQFSKYVQGHRYTGVDISRKLLARARHDFPGRDFIRSDIQSLPFKCKEFDTCVILQTIEHFCLDDLYPVLDEIQRVTRKIFICSVPRENMIPDASHILYFDEERVKAIFPAAVFWPGKTHHLLFTVDLIKSVRLFTRI